MISANVQPGFGQKGACIHTPLARRLVRKSRVYGVGFDLAPPVDLPAEPLPHLRPHSAEELHAGLSGSEDGR